MIPSFATFEITSPNHRADITMPVMNGFTATSEIRAHERATHMQPTKIIALTGLGSAGSQQEAFASGADLFLTKPVSMKALKGLLAGDDGGMAPGGVGSPTGGGPQLSAFPFPVAPAPKVVKLTTEAEPRIVEVPKPVEAEQPAIAVAASADEVQVQAGS